MISGLNELQPIQEQQIQDFAFELSMIDGPEDMFPPDSQGVREPRRPILPNPRGSEQLALAAVIDLAVARQNRRSIPRQCGAMVLHINELVTI